jgi:hypothetical protein
MASQVSDRSAPKYDRDFLLSPAKRNELIELWEVEKFGRDCFGDPHHVHLYGMPPKEWWGRGMRILARTCVEAVRCRRSLRRVMQWALRDAAASPCRQHPRDHLIVAFLAPPRLQAGPEPA